MPDHLALADRERDAVDGARRSHPRSGTRPEVLDLEQRLGGITSA
jgi:hypothetical protein